MDDAAQSWSLKGLDVQTNISALVSQREWAAQAKAQRERMGICTAWLGVKDMFEQGIEQIKVEHRTSITKSLQYVLLCLNTYSFRSLSICLGYSSTPDVLPSPLDQDFPGEGVVGRGGLRKAA